MSVAMTHCQRNGTSSWVSLCITTRPPNLANKQGQRKVAAYIDYKLTEALALVFVSANAGSQLVIVRLHELGPTQIYTVLFGDAQIVVLQSQWGLFLHQHHVGNPRMVQVVNQCCKKVKQADGGEVETADTQLYCTSPRILT